MDRRAGVCFNCYAGLGLTVNPFPFNQEDIVEAGGRVDPDFEERVDCNNYVMEDHETGMRGV